jgi:hypothetical protein
VVEGLVHRVGLTSLVKKFGPQRGDLEIVYQLRVVEDLAENEEPVYKGGNPKVGFEV